MNKAEPLDYCGFRVKGRKGLGHWEELLEEWIRCVERYCEIAKWKDMPFSYTERANIGVLSGAAWRCGRIGLEEFQATKKQELRPDWYGRADLYLASEEAHELIEAKFDWLSLASPKNVQNRLKKVLDAAIEDARATQAGDDGINCLAVAFLPAWLPTKRNNELNEKIASTVAMLEASDCHAVAWCFPGKLRMYEATTKENNIPGIVLAVKNLAYV